VHLTQHATSQPLYFLSAISLALCAEDGNEVCFDKLGCFSNGYPWNYNLRIAEPPDTPEKVGTTVLAYNRKMKNVTLKVYPEIDPKLLQNFDPKLDTFFLTHGYTGAGYNPWLHRMANAIIKRQPANVYIYDWTMGANVNYTKTLGNNRVVARIIANLIKDLVKEKHAKIDNIYLIGHSLGAQLMCNVGRQFKGEIGWLYAIEAAGPSFENLPREIRCSPDDAKYIAALHTDIGRDQYGYSQPLAKADYYFNNAVLQPPCQQQEFQPRRRCAHLSVTTYFTSVIAEKKGCFKGCPFKFTGVRHVKPIHGCGKKSVKLLLGDDKVTGVYQVNTSEEPPYCKL